MNRSKQQSFNDPRLRKIKAFGGTLRKNKKNRGARPVSSRHPLHLVFKSSRATGTFSFLQARNRKILHRTLRQMGTRYGLRFLEIGICGNHFHLLVKFQNRRLLVHFLRAFSGTLVRRICGTHKLAERFFDFRPFSRIVESLRGFQIARDYVFMNQLEGLGIIPYQKERTRLGAPKVFGGGTDGPLQTKKRRTLRIRDSRNLNVKQIAPCLVSGAQDPCTNFQWRPTRSCNKRFDKKPGPARTFQKTKSPGF